MIIDEGLTKYFIGVNDNCDIIVEKVVFSDNGDYIHYFWYEPDSLWIEMSRYEK